MTTTTVLLYGWLAERSGQARVFWDQEGISVGADYRAILSQRLQNCQVLVALIGPQWDPSPWVQREIGTALRRKALIVPVLIGSAPPIDPKSLPNRIRKLASLQCLKASDDRFRQRFMDAFSGIAISKPATRERADVVRTRRLIALLRRQSDLRQHEALRLIVDNRTDDALERLDMTFELLMALRDCDPDDLGLQIRLGFIYKDLAQVFETRDNDRFARYIELGLSLFEGIAQKHLKRHDRTSVWTGLGCLYMLSGQHERAVDCCERAAALAPNDGYIWSDLFLAYDRLASGGRIRIARLRRALRMIKNFREEELLRKEVPHYERMLEAWERKARTRRSRSQGTERSGSQHRTIE